MSAGTWRPVRRIDDPADAPGVLARNGALSRGERAALVALCALVAVAVVPFGSTGALAMPLALSLAGAWCVGGILVSRANWPVLSLLALALATALAGFMLLQASSSVGVLPPSAAFAEAARLLGRPLDATPSIAPGRTVAALAPTLVPLLVFAAALRLLRTDRAAVGVLRFLSLGGGVVALFGILQHYLAPDFVLLSRKTSYLGDLTAVFVNRNTAATFLGGTILVSLALAAYGIGRRPTLATLASLPFQPQADRRDHAVLLPMAVASIALVALALTSSRAGGAATLAALMLLTALLYRGRTPSGGRGALRRAGAVLLVAMVPAVVLGGRTIERAISQGTEDGRFCVFPAIARLAEASLPWGTGAGTFELAFRPYRDPACGIHGVWDRAHSFFLEGLVTLGLPFALATFAALLALVLTFRHGWRSRRRYRFGPALGFALVLLLVLHDLVDFSLQIPGIALWAAVMLASACALCRRERGNPERSLQFV